MEDAVVAQNPGIGRLVRRIFDSTLGLSAQVVMHSCDDDDKLIACIDGLVNQADVVRGFPGLNRTDDHSTPVPRAVTRGFLQSLQNHVRQFVKVIHDIGRPS